MSVKILADRTISVSHRAFSGTGEGNGFTFNPDAWVDLAYPCSEKRSLKDGSSYQAAFTPAGLGRMVQAFKAEKAKNPEFALLVNKDHLAHVKGNTSEAVAWITDLKLEDDGHLYGKFRWTSIGIPLASGGVYRFPSVEVDDFDTPAKQWPTKGAEWNVLCGAAITNQPALENLVPFCHRKEFAPIEEEKQPKGHQMEKIKLMLGLAPEATEAEVEAAVQALQDQVAAEAAAKAEGEMAKKAEEFSKAHADKFTDEASAAAFFRALPETAEEMVATFRVVETEKIVEKIVEKAAPVSHRKAGHPEDDGDQTPAGLYRRWNEMPEGQDKSAFLKKNQTAINAGAQTK